MITFDINKKSSETRILPEYCEKIAAMSKAAQNAGTENEQEPAEEEE